MEKYLGNLERYQVRDFYSVQTKNLINYSHCCVCIRSDTKQMNERDRQEVSIGNFDYQEQACWTRVMPAVKPTAASSFGSCN